MDGLFITFEGTEGSGKSTQIGRLADRLGRAGHRVRVLREPGGTPIGEEIRHTLKHSEQNQAMTAEAELLLMNASRAQLVREVIQPALAAGEIILCDRFYDSTTAYQGYGRPMDLSAVQQIIGVAVGRTRPDLTLLLSVPVAISEQRRQVRQDAPNERAIVPGTGHRTDPPAGRRATRDRIEDAGRDFFERVERGYAAIAASEPDRFCVIDATRSVSEVEAEIWKRVRSLLEARVLAGGRPAP